MKLRDYKEKDSAIICSWIKDEKSLYQWSADRIEKFPLYENALNENYAPVISNEDFIPLSAVDENDTLIGHLFIRYPNKMDRSIVRFGYVIINPSLRNNGNGQRMLGLAIDYAKKELHASKIMLGVFANNDSALFCYKAVGFRSVGKTELYKMKIGEWECMEMELVIE